MDAVSCGHLLLDALLAADWGLPAMMISDRDSKSMVTMWKTILDSLGTKLLRSTAYHPRTDGQSERMNQNVEMTLRYYMAKYLVGALEIEMDTATIAVCAQQPDKPEHRQGSK